MLGNQLPVFGNIACIEVYYAQIHEYIQQEREIHKGKIQSVFLLTNSVKNLRVNADNIERLNKKVKKNQ